MSSDSRHGHTKKEKLSQNWSTEKPEENVTKKQSGKCFKRIKATGFFVTFPSTQDFVIYLLAGPKIVIGRQIDHEDESKPDILLSAADILPSHCYFHRHSAGGPTMLCPCQNAVVTRSGRVLRKEVQLSPGDVIGLGQHYLFLFKDPLALMHKVRQGLFQR